ncbi:hypothetical protein [Acinetobacter sp. A47]|uniref:hypothetical protein n=1 Tax=Acinetobacter sp. A47 TaxID=1561217 RepID=UPI0005710D67|nr:hypothetical protein [Acinetobacter sp. A47]
MSGLSLSKSKNQLNEKATEFTQNAPVQTTITKTTVDDEKDSKKSAPKNANKKDEQLKIAPWRQGLNINPEDLKLIQRPFNNNISHENYLRLVYLKSLGSIKLGANKDTFSSMLDEALTEYTARRLKALGDNYDV